MNEKKLKVERRTSKEEKEFELSDRSVAKPFPSNCGSLDLLFSDFSMILRILSPIFSQLKKRKEK